MKVLHLAAGNLFGGVESYLFTLARLRQLCPEMEPHYGLCFPGRLHDELAATGVPIHDLGPVRASRPWSVLRGRRRLKALIRDGDYSALVTHGCWPHAMFAAVGKRAGVRVVNFVHDALAGRHWIDRWASRTRPDAVIANSHFTAGTAGTVFPGVAVEVSYLPVAEPVIEDREATRREFRAALNTPSDAVVILQASRLERWKGQAIHMEALVRLKEDSGWQAWIAGGAQKAGENEFHAELVAAAERGGIADRVQFLGQRSDVAQLMAAADIYCQPNTGPEPFGIAFVEALYSRLPVVTSDLGGAKEIVTDSCGVLCPPGDAGAVAGALRELIANEKRRSELGSAGPARAAGLCDPTRQMTRLAAGLFHPASSCK